MRVRGQIQQEVFSRDVGTVVERPNPPLSLGDLASKAGRTGGPISANASLNARGVGAGYSTQMADIEVDPETGVSRVVRYTTDFTPAPWLEADADTTVLYHFGEGTGTTAKDASSNGYDADLFSDSWSTDDSAC